MKKSIGSYPRVGVEGGGRGVVSQAGAVLLVETVRKTGLDQAISAALAPWRKPRAVHDREKDLLDIALAVAIGGGLADVGMLRAEPDVFGPVASASGWSRLRWRTGWWLRRRRGSQAGLRGTDPGAGGGEGDAVRRQR